MGSVVDSSSPVKIFVGRIPKFWTAADLRCKFEHFGGIVECCILKKQKTSSSKGNACGFIWFNSFHIAKKAMQEMHGKPIEDSDGTLQVKFADGEIERLGLSTIDQSGGECAKVFIGSLPGDADEKIVSGILSHYGPVDEIHLLAPHRTRKTRAAFCVFLLKEDAQRAILSLNGKVTISPASNPLEVRMADRGSLLNAGSVLAVASRQSNSASIIQSNHYQPAIHTIKDSNSSNASNLPSDCKASKIPRSPMSYPSSLTAASPDPLSKKLHPFQPNSANNIDPCLTGKEVLQPGGDLEVLNVLTPMEGSYLNRKNHARIEMNSSSNPLTFSPEIKIMSFSPNDPNQLDSSAVRLDSPYCMTIKDGVQNNHVHNCCPYFNPPSPVGSLENGLNFRMSQNLMSSPPYSVQQDRNAFPASPLFFSPSELYYYNNSYDTNESCFSGSHQTGSGNYNQYNNDSQQQQQQQQKVMYNSYNRNTISSSCQSPDSASFVEYNASCDLHYKNVNFPREVHANNNIIYAQNTNENNNLTMSLSNYHNKASPSKINIKCSPYIQTDANGYSVFENTSFSSPTSPLLTNEVLPFSSSGLLKGKIDSDRFLNPNTNNNSHKIDNRNMKSTLSELLYHNKPAMLDPRHSIMNNSAMNQTATFNIENIRRNNRCPPIKTDLLTTEIQSNFSADNESNRYATESRDSRYLTTTNDSISLFNKNIQSCPSSPLFPPYSNHECYNDNIKRSMHSFQSNLMVKDLNCFNNYENQIVQPHSISTSSNNIPTTSGRNLCDRFSAFDKVPFVCNNEANSNIQLASSEILTLQQQHHDWMSNTINNESPLSCIVTMNNEDTSPRLILREKENNIKDQVKSHHNRFPFFQSTAETKNALNNEHPADSTILCWMNSFSNDKNANEKQYENGDKLIDDQNYSIKNEKALTQLNKNAMSFITNCI